jgi:hypothetical protein
MESFENLLEKTDGDILIENKILTVERYNFLSNRVIRIKNSKLIFKPTAGIALKNGIFEAENSLFLAANNLVGWGNIALVGDISGYIKNCSFEYAKGTQGGDFVNGNFEIPLEEGVAYGGALLIYLKDTKNFKVTSVRFSHCTADFGGAIYTDGDVEIENCIFEHCEALTEIGSGGAIYALKGATIKNSLFKECRAVWGGGVYVFTENKLIDSTFIGCKAQQDGGGAFAWENNLIKGCFFENCSAVNWGGGLKVFQYNSIRESIFSWCFSENEGGGLDLRENNLVDSCIFNHCYAKKGGAIDMFENNTIRNCSFSHCLAEQGRNYFGAKENKIIDCVED